MYVGMYRYGNGDIDVDVIYLIRHQLLTGLVGGTHCTATYCRFTLARRLLGPSHFRVG